ncbi:MAG TPA: hypothetical protein VH442_19415, partial [Micromonosporaceae bacterium]
VTSTDDARVPVDIDRLADYTEGLLPAAEAADVARLIARDARWARAAEQLRSALPEVADALAASAAVAEPMPDAVLDRVLRTLPNRPDAATHSVPGDRFDRAVAEPPNDSKITRVISLSAHRRRRQRVWASLARVAAALVILAGIGVGLGYVTQHSGTSNTSGAANSESAPKAARAQRAPAPIPTEASGHDYTGELSHAPAGLGGGNASPDSMPPRSSAAGTPGSPPPTLSRLASGGLDACVAAVAAQYGAQPISADFAYFRSVPAVIFRFTNGLLVAVGPDCGLPGKGADAVATSR